MLAPPLGRRHGTYVEQEVAAVLVEKKDERPCGLQLPASETPRPGSRLVAASGSASDRSTTFDDSLHGTSQLSAAQSGQYITQLDVLRERKPPPRRLTSNKSNPFIHSLKLYKMADKTLLSNVSRLQ